MPRESHIDFLHGFHGAEGTVRKHDKKIIVAPLVLSAPRIRAEKIDFGGIDGLYDFIRYVFMSDGIIFSSPLATIVHIVMVWGEENASGTAALFALYGKTRLFAESSAAEKQKTGFLFAEDNLM